VANIDKNFLEAEIKKMISEIAEIEPEKITKDANFVEDLGMDSMMALEVLASLEKKYNIKIPEDNLTKITSLNNVVVLLMQLLG